MLSGQEINPNLDMMGCPRCRRVQKKSDECIYCGIVFSKYLQKQQKRERLQKTKQSPKSGLKPNIKRNLFILVSTAVLSVVIVFIFLYLPVYLNESADIQLAQGAIQSLIRGDTASEEMISWETLRVSDINVGMIYLMIPSEEERSAFRKSFIPSFSSSMQAVSVDTWHNWRIHHKDSAKIVVYADTPNNKTAVLTISLKDGKQTLSGIQGVDSNYIDSLTLPAENKDSDNEGNPISVGDSDDPDKIFIPTCLEIQGRFRDFLDEAEGRVTDAIYEIQNTYQMEKKRLSALAMAIYINDMEGQVSQIFDEYDSYRCTKNIGAISEDPATNQSYLRFKRAINEYTLLVRRFSR